MTDQNEQLQKAILALKKLKAQVDAYESVHHDPIAIIGMACRLPGHSNDLQHYWKLLIEGQQGIGKIPSDRWKHEDFFSDNPNEPGKYSASLGSFIDDVKGFDRHFFNLTEEETLVMDPHHRILLMVTWEALQNAYLPPSEIAGKNVGVFLGMGSDKSDYLIKLGANLDKVNAFSGLGTTMNGAAGRISFLLNSKGPSMSVDTACSSSLVALHSAVHSLRRKECDIAIVGGISLMLSPLVYVMCTKMGVLSKDGQTRGFDQSAAGFGRGEGCGVIILKRQKDAEAAGDNILASIKGTAINHNGQSMSLSAPSQLSQELLLQQCLDAAQLKAEEVSYVEAHATASEVGDSLELEAIKSVYGKNRTQECYLSSAESNFGHLDAATGLVKLIKVVLAMQHDEIPAHLGFQQLNKNVNLADSKISIAAKNVSWPRGEKARVAGVSAFGWTGQNAHVLVQDYKSEIKQNSMFGPPYLLPLSAKTPEAFSILLKQYAEFLMENSDKIADICRLASLGRDHYALRQAFLGNTAEELISAIKSYSAEKAQTFNQKIALVFPKGDYKLDSIKAMNSKLDFSQDSPKEALIRLWTHWIGKPEKIVGSSEEATGNYPITMTDERGETKKILCALYNAGKKINFTHIYENKINSKLLELPKHPWLNEDYWI